MAIYNTILGPDTTLCFIDLSDEYATVNIVIITLVLSARFILSKIRVCIKYTDVWFTTLKFKNLSPYAGGYFTRLKANCVTSVDFYPRV